MKKPGYIYDEEYERRKGNVKFYGFLLLALALMGLTVWLGVK